MYKRRLYWLAVWLTGCAAALLLMLTAGSEKAAEQWMLPADRSAGRAGERMDALTPRGAVSVNTAGVDELCLLRGVGAETAQRIIDERERNGRFAYPEDLLAVKGIGSKTLKKLYDQLSLD